MTESIEFDRTDRAILDELQKNARASFSQLAARTGVAPSTCLERVRSLRNHGVIRGFGADIDLRRIGRNLQALIAIRFRTHSRERVEPFITELLAVPDVVEVFNLTGEDDFLLHVAVADIDRLYAFVLDRLGVRPEIEHVKTSLIYRHFRKQILVPVDD